MRRASIPEWILARITDPARAAAVMGDLEELAVARGRVWFWSAYVRTLVALGWRACVAFFLSLVSVATMVRLYPIWVHHELGHLSTGWHVNVFFGQLAVESGPLLNAIAMSLWFVLPFAWMRFGRRDRLTTFASAMFLSTMGVFSFRPWLIDASSIATLLIILAALFSSLWRRPLTILVVTSLTMIAAMVGSFRLLAMNQHRAFITFSPATDVRWAITTFVLAFVAFVCSLLHRKLLRTCPTVV
jgi:hypothetical protein